MNKLKQFRGSIRSHQKEVREHFINLHKDFRVNPVPSKFNIVFFDSIEFVPEKVWNSINVQNNIFLQSAYLRALAAAPPEGMEFRYTILYEGEKPVAIASFQILKVEVSRYGPKLTEGAINSIKDKINNVIYNVKEKHSIRMLVCGNILVSGENGFSYLPDINPEEVFHGLAEATYKIQGAENMTDVINCVLIKDFYQKKINPSEKLKDYGYHQFSAGPNMVVHIPKEWNSFDDYISAMTGKYRGRARSAMRKKAGIIQKELTADEISTHRETIYELYLQVHKRSKFRIVTLNPRMFEELKAQLGEAFSFEAYFLDDIMVGFTTRLFNGNVIEGYVHGIDYQQNKKYALYENILYDDIRSGITNKMRQINFGRTSLAMKSSVGAKPIEMGCYLRLNNPVSNHFVNTLLHFINPEEDHIRNPFGKNKG